MFASAPAARPCAGGVPRRAATRTAFDASERASAKKRPSVAPARGSSACLTKMARNRNSVVTAAGMKVLTVDGETSSKGLLQKCLASELHAMRGILKKAELISRRGASKGSAPTPTAGNKDRFLDSKQRPKPIEDGGRNAPSAKRRKISTPVEQKQKQKQMPALELKTKLDKFAEEHKDEKLAEERKDEKLAEERKDEKLVRGQDEEYADISGGLLTIIKTGNECVYRPAQVQSGEAKKVQDVQRPTPKAVDMRDLIYKANVRRQQLEMERAALPDQSIHRRDLQRLCIARPTHW